jgi:colicin import membrane protein
MATALKPVETGTDIVVAVTQNPGIVLLDQQKFDAFYDKLKADAPKDADVATRKGQELLRSFAARVRSEKAAIDKARLGLTKEWRDMTAQANAAGKIIEERLESLAIEVRKPLTDWEEAEKARVHQCYEILSGVTQAAVITIDDTAEMVRDRGAAVWNTVLDPEKFGDQLESAEATKAEAVATLKSALARLTREEEDRAELERLRAENEAREAKERAEAEARAAAEVAAEEARQAEQRRLDAEKAETERLAAIARDAEDRARREAEQAAEAERQRVAREHDAALASERARAEEAERAAKADRERVAAAEAARVAEQERIAAETAKREANQAHRAKIMKAAKEAIMTCGIDEETAKKVVLLIRAGEVPNVSLAF